MSTHERRSMGVSTGASAAVSVPTGVAREFAPATNSEAPHASVIHRAVCVHCIIIKAAIIEAVPIRGSAAKRADPRFSGEELPLFGWENGFFPIRDAP
jgi:hypothetical protein